MKVLVIGANGFIANAIGAYSNENDLTITVIGRTKPKKYLCQHFIQSTLKLEGFPFDKCLTFDVIIYAAAEGVQSEKIFEDESLFYVNTYFPIILSEKLKKGHFKGKIITFGSYFEIGDNSQNKIYSEDEVIHSDLSIPNNYCLSKRLLTRYVSSLVNSSSNFHFILPTIYGEGEQYNRLLPYLIKNILEGKDVSLTSGEQIRQYLYVADFVSWLFYFIDNNSVNGIYNCPCAETLSVKEVAGKVYRYFNLSMPETIFGKEIRSDTTMKVLQLKADKSSNDTFKLIEEIISKYAEEYQKPR